ncbi:MAG: flagellar basal body-associated FliL family protein [Pseudomonadota bacterium]|nr:flagellar basal body-associated protein FliL [Pseudomonadales bacterium]MDY6920295.1 flagellar basal body-associated FliL family protein [Pseudomonadota bacterium]
MKLIRNMVILVSILAPPLALGEEETAVPGNDTVYVELKPSFVTNYQARRMGYLKADVTLQVKGEQTAEAVSRHRQSIRHQLVMLFSRQQQDSLNTLEGKQMLKEAALTEVVQALEVEGEPAQVEDILFTSFIVD